MNNIDVIYDKNDNLILYENEYLVIKIDDKVVDKFDITPKDIPLLVWYCNTLKKDIKTVEKFTEEIGETSLFMYETPLYWSDTERYFNWIVENGELEETMDNLAYELEEYPTYKELIECVVFTHGDLRCRNDFELFENELMVEYKSIA